MSDNDERAVYVTPPGHEFRTWTRVPQMMACTCDFRGTEQEWRQHQYGVLVNDIAQAVLTALREPVEPPAPSETAQS